MFDSHGEITNVITQTGKRLPTHVALLSVLYLHTAARRIVYFAPPGQRSCRLAGRHLFACRRHSIHHSNLAPPADIMRYLLAHLGELGGVADRTIEQLGLLTGEAAVQYLPSMRVLLVLIESSCSALPSSGRSFFLGMCAAARSRSVHLQPLH